MLRHVFTVILIGSLFGCRKHQLFDDINADRSGINFRNIIADDDTLNVLDVENIYNGGGVGIGDFNNDGLPDIYFTANTVSNKLYLNSGDFKFRDATNVSGANGEGKWCRGVSVIDINNDGLLDMYVCATLSKDETRRRNILYINTGIDKEGIPHFSNQAAAYGLDDVSHSTMAAFFDYDNDGDLDMYLLNNEIIRRAYPNQFRKILRNSENPNTDKLFRNDWDDKLHHPVYTDVSRQAGITIEGYGHGVNICDINNDGWKDVYVTNDFLPNNLLYINNHDGTFSDKAASYFKHTSANSMGQDIIDINNDGLPDIIEVDMNPEDNYRKKMMLNANNYLAYQNSDFFGYQYQYVRNVLQLNQGPRVLQNDSVGQPVFSDIGFLAGIAETDWSWTPLVTDFNNDGFRDMIITNGFPKDVTDHDFIAFRNKSFTLLNKKEILDQVPEVKLASYAYKNNGDLTFTDLTKEWGLTKTKFSSGAAYADLDNDGDLDFVVNNTNDDASLYRNNQQDQHGDSSNYLRIKLTGDAKNKNALGASVEITYAKSQRQVWEATPYRGYLSTNENIAHFGLGSAKKVDMVIVSWPNGKQQLLKNVNAGQLLQLDIRNATIEHRPGASTIDSTAIFTDATTAKGINHVHHETDYIDFDRERLLPHKFSQYGPGLAAADVDGNGLDDMYVGGSAQQPGTFLLQQPNGKFVPRPLPDTALDKGHRPENMGVLLFDADNDNDIDLYCANGGNEYSAGNKSYGDKLYINDGKGNFSSDSIALPANFTSKSCIKAADYDHDGDLDLFIGGRCLPGKYPLPVSSFIYRNDSKNGVAKFTDVSSTVCKALQNLGLVCDATWTDFDNDGAIDLVLAGEWMPITFLRNMGNSFENVTSSTGLAGQTGWWNSITAGDFDNDGDIDYVAGNLGRNAYFRASEQYPVTVYAKDFDNNGAVDAMMTIFLKDLQGEKKEFPAFSRDDIVSQIPSLKKKFLTYKQFAVADINTVFSKEQLRDALVLKAVNFSSCYIQNNGGGKFALKPLPIMAQLAPLNGMVVDDLNEDGNLDIAICGNDYGNEVSAGRYDAMNGLVMLGDGKGNFVPLTIQQSGLFVPGDAKALVSMRGSNNSYLLAASQNQGPVKVFQARKGIRAINVEPADTYALLKLRSGVTRKQELYFGSSFLSQSARILNVDENIVSVQVVNSKGSKRTVNL